MTIFQRYVGREIAVACAGVTAVLLAILLINQLVAVLRRAAEGQVPTSVVLDLLWLGAAKNITIILPIGLLLGVVIALGRLYHESEMTAAKAWPEFLSMTFLRSGASDSYLALFMARKKLSV